MKFEAELYTAQPGSDDARGRSPCTGTVDIGDHGTRCLASKDAYEKVLHGADKKRESTIWPNHLTKRAGKRYARCGDTRIQAVRWRRERALPRGIPMAGPRQKQIWLPLPREGPPHRSLALRWKGRRQRHATAARCQCRKIGTGIVASRQRQRDVDLRSPTNRICDVWDTVAASGAGKRPVDWSALRRQLDSAGRCLHSQARLGCVCADSARGGDRSGV